MLAKRNDFDAYREVLPIGVPDRFAVLGRRNPDRSSIIAFGTLSMASSTPSSNSTSTPVPFSVPDVSPDRTQKRRQSHPRKPRAPDPSVTHNLMQWPATRPVGQPVVRHG